VLSVSNVPVRLHVLCRFPIQPSEFVQAITHSNSSSRSQQLQQSPQAQCSLIQQWGGRIAPVASLVLCELRAGTSTSADGALAAKVHLSSLLLVNLQLLDLCQSDATMPSAAGVYLPAGIVVPSNTKPSVGGAPHGQYRRASAADAAAAAEAVVAAAVPCLLANHNAFVLSAFTPRLTAAYQSATLSR
jgi:hypothetical protein